MKKFLHFFFHDWSSWEKEYANDVEAILQKKRCATCGAVRVAIRYSF